MAITWHLRSFPSITTVNPAKSPPSFAEGWSDKPRRWSSCLGQVREALELKEVVLMYKDMGVSENREAPPKWMIWGYPYFRKHPYRWFLNCKKPPGKTSNDLRCWWFQPTHLKNMLVKLGSSSPGLGVKIKNIWVATTKFDMLRLLLSGCGSDLLLTRQLFGGLIRYTPGLDKVVKIPKLWTFHVSQTITSEKMKTWRSQFHTSKRWSS